jgi:hypothetical protein
MHWLYTRFIAKPVTLGRSMVFCTASGLWLWLILRVIFLALRHFYGIASRQALHGSALEIGMAVESFILALLVGLTFALMATIYCLTLFLAGRRGISQWYHSRPRDCGHACSTDD